MALMQRKNTQSYKDVARIINERWIDSDHITRIHTDYEIAEYNGLSATFGKDKLHGCLVHYIRALNQHLMKEFPNVYKVYIAEKKYGGPLRKWV